MGIGLTVAFVLYAMNTWSATLRPATIAVSPGATHDLQRVLATVSAGAAAVLAALLIAWALGTTIGLPAAAAAQRTIVGSLINAIDGLLALGGAAGVLMMVHRFGGHRPFWMPLALTWLGAGSMFGWGLWQLIIVLSQSPLLRVAEGMAVVNLTGLLRLVIGLVMGLLMVFALAERASATAKPSEAGT
jgi:hypothetical protein